MGNGKIGTMDPMDLMGPGEGWGEGGGLKIEGNGASRESSGEKDRRASGTQPIHDKDHKKTRIRRLSFNNDDEDNDDN